MAGKRLAVRHPEGGSLYDCRAASTDGAYWFCGACDGGVLCGWTGETCKCGAVVVQGGSPPPTPRPGRPEEKKP